MCILGHSFFVAGREVYIASSNDMKSNGFNVIPFTEFSCYKISLSSFSSFSWSPYSSSSSPSPSPPHTLPHQTTTTMTNPPPPKILLACLALHTPCTPLPLPQPTISERIPIPRRGLAPSDELYVPITSKLQLQDRLCVQHKKMSSKENCLRSKGS